MLLKHHVIRIKPNVLLVQNSVFAYADRDSFITPSTILDVLVLFSASYWTSDALIPAQNVHVGAFVSRDAMCFSGYTSVTRLPCSLPEAKSTKFSSGTVNEHRIGSRSLAQE